MADANRDSASDFLAKGDFVYRDSPQPPVFVEAKGARLVDNQGQTYLDAEAANGTVGLGYDATILQDAVSRVQALSALPSFCESALRLKVAARIAKLLEERTGLRGRVAFELGGAQAIDLALRVAALQREGGAIAVFEGGYHGRSDLSSWLSASARYRSARRTRGPEIHRFPLPDCERCRFGRTRSACHLECVAFVEASYHAEYAGLVDPSRNAVFAAVVEPTLNVAGMVFPEPAYVRAMVDQARAAGALIIIDEVFTGLYRTGTRWGFEQHGIVPDMVVFSKGFTNGLVALSGVWAREPLMDVEHFKPGTHSITYGNNPLSLAVVDAVLDRYDRDIATTGKVAMLEAGLRTILDNVRASSGLVFSVDVRGGVGRIRLSRPIASQIRRIAREIGYRTPILGYHGLLVASTGMAPDVISLHPPLNLAPEELPAIEQLLKHSFASAERERG